MNLTMLNREQFRSWAKGRRYIYSVKGKAPDGATYDDGTPIVGDVNVAWKDADTGEQFDLVYAQGEGTDEGF